MSDTKYDINVLYIEDDKVTRMIFTKILGGHFTNVRLAENGKIGLDMFKDEKPDVVITDLAMPEMDGFELITRIREMDKEIPIIITTAYQEEALKLNDVSGVIIKPITYQDVIDAVLDELGLEAE